MSDQHCFNSQQRSTGDTTSDFTIWIRAPIDMRNKQLRFRLLQMANSAFNLPSGSILDVSGTAIPLTPGIYSLAEAASMIKTTINASLGAGAVDVTTNSSTATLTFTFVDAQTLQFASGASASSKNHLWRILGFTTDDGLRPVNSGPATVITSPHSCTFGSPEALCIKMYLNDQFIAPITIGDPSNCLQATMVVPMLSVIGGMFRLTQADTSLLIRPQMTSITKVRMIVTDMYGTQVDLNNANWWIIFDREPLEC